MVLGYHITDQHGIAQWHSAAANHRNFLWKRALKVIQSKLHLKNGTKSNPRAVESSFCPFLWIVSSRWLKTNMHSPCAPLTAKNITVPAWKERGELEAYFLLNVWDAWHLKSYKELQIWNHNLVAAEHMLSMYVMYLLHTTKHTSSRSVRGMHNSVMCLMLI